MKTLNALIRYSISITLGILVIGCGKSPVDSMNGRYQTRTAQVLQRMSSNVSRGFVANSQGSGRGLSSLDTYYTNYYGQYSPNPYQNISGAMDLEVQNCAQLVANIPANCENFAFMASSMARCLDRIIQYHNPLMTYAFKKMNNRGQQYWAYLLDRGQSSSDINLFLGSAGYNPMMNYANYGYYNTSCGNGSAYCN